MLNTDNKPTILCVDSDPITADWISAILARSQTWCSVETADKGRDAFSRMMSDRFDLCIMEYALPDMTGVQLCGLMRQIGCRVPVLFFTAMNRPIDRELAYAAGATEYLSKPDDLDLFADAVKFLLKRRKPIYVPQFSERTYASAA